MAAPRAYTQPTVNSAWEAFLEHVPTILLIWITTAVISAAGFAVSLVIALVGVGIAGSGSGSEEATTLITVLGNLAQLPFAVLSSLVGVLFIAVPALHYACGEVITTQAAFKALMDRPLRYLLAGILFSLALIIGIVLCVVPGIVVALVMPVYVNRIFLTDRPIGQVFTASFEAVFGSEQGRSFAIVEILAWLVTAVVSLCTCGLGALVAVPVNSFYLQNAAYHKGVIS
jgi:hypothetical protein